MNYYEHHIGDYAEATAHLSFVEDAAYSRLIRKYYAQEKALPADLKAVQRLVGARTKEEKEAVETVLAEFFELQDDGWHQGRCDEVIAKYLETQPEREAKKEAERERQRRTRERRKQLFEALRAYGIVPDFSATMTQLQDMLSRAESQEESHGVTHDVTPPVTRDNTATQTPDTNTQSPDLKPGVATTGDNSTVVGAICVGLRRVGIQVSPHQMQVQELGKQVEAQAITVETVLAAGDEARRSKPDERIGIGLVIAILDSWAKKAKAMSVAGARPPSQHPTSRDAQRAGAMNSIGLGGHLDEQPLTFDAATGDISR